jgi:hypothetical protein
VPVRNFAAFLLILFLAIATQARAQIWADFATVSMTDPTHPKLVNKNLCYTDGTDIACDGAAGLLTTSGTFSITNISATNLTVGGVAITGSSSGDRITSGTASVIANTSGGYISLTTGATTWGYLGSSATYLPLVSGTYHYGQYASFTALTVGGVAVTGGGGTTRLSSLTDVTTTGVVSGSVLAYNGATSSWTALPIQQVMSTTTMVQGWPDAIRCYRPGTSDYMTLYYIYSGTSIYYRFISNDANDYNIQFNTSGAYMSQSNLSTSDCATNSWSISQLYANGRAFNFIGTASTSSTSSGDRITSGTTSMVANSATSIISITNAGVTAGYFNSNGVLTAPGISATANLTSVTSLYASGNVGIGTTGPKAKLDVAGTISATSGIQVGAMSATCASGISGTIRYNTTSNTMEYCTGTAWANLGPSATTPVAFRVNKNGTNQTVTAGTATKLTWSTEEFDTNNNFASDRFTPTVPGKYLIAANTYCIDSTAGCALYIEKNGTVVAQAYTGVNTSQGLSAASTILDMNGSTDYVETYVVNGGGTTINGSTTASSFSGALLSPQGGSGGSTSPGGNNTNIQYNSGGNFAGSDNLAWDNTNRNLQVSGSMQFGGTGSEACSSAADYGKNRRNPTSGRMQVCLFR